MKIWTDLGQAKITTTEVPRLFLALKMEDIRNVFNLEGVAPQKIFSIALASSDQARGYILYS